MSNLQDYIKIVGKDSLNKLEIKSKEIKGKKVLHINSTMDGGGVAEILHSLVPLMNDVGIKADWKAIKGRKDFFQVTKKIHNALQGGVLPLTNIEKRIHIEINRANASNLEIDADCVVVHCKSSG